MLQLRKILLSDKLFITIFILVTIISIVRLTIPKRSKYNLNSNYLIGIVTKIQKDEEKVILYIKAKENIIVYFYPKEKVNINLGDKLLVKGLFTKPESQKTKYLFDYQKYLKRKNIFYQVKATSIKKVKSNKNIYYYIKQLIINSLGNSTYLHTFLIGDKSLIQKNVIRSYQENGISHLFAISGMHISLLAGIINKLLRKKLSEENTFKITSFILILYLLLVGLSPSILRGVLFYILFSLNRIYYFYIKPKNIFLLILSFSLLLNPNYIYDTGFQYSYLISYSLLSMSDYLKSNNYFISLLKVSLLSFYVSIPISLCSFYQINLLGIIYNLIFVPLVSLVIFPFSLIVFIIKPLEPLYNSLTNILECLSLFFSKIQLGKIIFQRLPLFVYIIYIITILLFVNYKRKFFMIILITILIIHYLLPFFNNSTYLRVLDVGQGDSLLLHIKKKNILIDTGGSIDNKKEIFYNSTLPILKSTGIKKINLFLISHGDADHMGEAINLVNNFKVEKVIFNCGPYNNLEKDLIKVLDKKKIKYYSCIKELNIDNNKLYFLQTEEYDNENDNSNVIYTELDGYKFMFMGDAGIEKEKDILSKYNISNVDVLKVGHHGSKTSSGKEFINEINPKYSIISVGKNNRYGHPNKEVLNNLEDSKIYRTDEVGSIMFKIKNNKLKIETCSP